MSIHLYYSLIPEALIASMLPPEKFGQYYATVSYTHLDVYKRQGFLFRELDADLAGFQPGQQRAVSRQDADFA